MRKSQSVYTFRLRAPRGLDNTLIKELKQHGFDNQIGSLESIKKIPGRKAVEIRGPLSLMWDILFRSRIAEDLQVRMTQSFLARGETELRRSFQKLPWACYLPLAEFEEYDPPQIRAKTYKSKLYHEKMTREIFLQEVHDLPIYKSYNQYKREVVQPRGQAPMSFKRYKKEWLKTMQARQDDKIKQKLEESKADEHDGEKTTGSRGFKSLDDVRNEFKVKAEVLGSKKRQGRLLLNIVKDKAEVLVSTSYQDLHKHGYRPYMRWGSLKETLTAACILESGILERARRSGKLYVWDPFCGSGTFLIELIQMALGRPCRTLHE